MFWDVFEKASQSFKIVINKKVFGLANIIENHYDIWLIDILKPIIVNQVTTYTIET